MCQWLARNLGADVPLHFTAFHPDYHLRDRPRTSEAILTRARQIAIKHGLRYVYTGNVHDQSGGSTYCHACGKRRVPGRDWYVITEYNLSDDGVCPLLRCAAPGCLKGPAGSWGAKRGGVGVRRRFCER